MNVPVVSGRKAVVLACAGIAMLVLSACENGPRMADLAPRIPKLNPEVPETAHPEQTSAAQFPNINEAPDRPSETHDKAKLEEIEKSLEQDGEQHVKQAVGKITGKPPEDIEGKQAKGGKDNKAAGAAGSNSGNAGKPLQLSPPPSDKPS